MRQFWRTSFLASACLGAACLHGQVELPHETMSLPNWPGSASAARRLPGEFVFRDTSGEIVVSYPDPSDPARDVTFRFWLQNRVAPKITVRVKHMPGEKYYYDYSVENESIAKTSIREWSLAGPPSPGTVISHATWQGVNTSQMPNAQTLFKDARPRVYLSWIDMKAAMPIEPGHTLSGFEIVSPFRPGLTVAFLAGSEAPITLQEDSPEAVEQQITRLQQRPFMEKVAVTIGPRFPPDMDPREILRGFARDIDESVKGGFLDMESPFVRDLEESIVHAEESSQLTFEMPKKAPRTPMERGLLDALKLALSAQP